jgi:RNA polymerase sigma-70 factor
VSRGELTIDDATLVKLYRRARADRWSLPTGAFAAALDASVRRVFAGAVEPRELTRYLESLHLEDLALACACALGHDGAWEHFVREHRPVLYRAADQIDQTGGAREIADALYAELFGLAEREGRRESLFRHFHGRSSLSTWLRAVLSQRHIDRFRTQSRTVPLPDEAAVAAKPQLVDPDRPRYVSLVRGALARSLARLDARDRLRLSLYYAQQLTLAQIGRLFREHEATVSRQLSRIRKAIRDEIEGDLRAAGLGDAEIGECLISIVDDPGPLDLGEMLETAGPRKESASARSR